MKKLILSAMVGAFALSTTPSTAHAEYGMAGCGLGSMILKDDGFMQIFAATTNGTSGNQTFGISSGTSNCEVSGNGASAALFIEANREAVGKEISRGTGESLETLARLGGCASANDMSSYLQSQYASIFPSAKTSDKQVGMTIVTMLKDNEQLQCTDLHPTG